MDYPLSIKEITSSKAILKDQDNNLVYLPINKLPKNISVGQTLILKIELETNNNNSIAKEILNELLGSKQIDS
jgi:hypothetical protein